MSIDLNGIGSGMQIQTAQYVRHETAVTETAEEKSEKKQQVDTFEKSAGKVSYQMDTETVNQMKADLETQKSRFLTSVKDMLTKQGVKVAEGDGIWKQIAQGKVKADPETIEAAKKDTAEDGYWGVKQTSERFIKYAKALTGGDPSKAKAMREAFEKGYKEAEKAWGGQLPELSQKTYDATMKLFDEWEQEGQT